jgi:hypothetical protein
VCVLVSLLRESVCVRERERKREREFTWNDIHDGSRALPGDEHGICFIFFWFFLDYKRILNAGTRAFTHVLMYVCVYTCVCARMCIYIYN